MQAKTTNARVLHEVIVSVMQANQVAPHIHVGSEYTCEDPQSQSNDLLTVNVLDVRG